MTIPLIILFPSLVLASSKAINTKLASEAYDHTPNLLSSHDCQIGLTNLTTTPLTTPTPSASPGEAIIAKLASYLHHGDLI